MIETQLATVTAKIVLDVMNKVTGGALEEVGGQIVQYLKTKFQNNFKLYQFKENPELLETLVLDKALEDKSFKSELEQLVFKF